MVEVKFVEFALAPESNQGLDDFKAWHMHAKITKKTLDASTAKSLMRAFSVWQRLTLHSGALHAHSFSLD